MSVITCSNPLGMFCIPNLTASVSCLSFLKLHVNCKGVRKKIISFRPLISFFNKLPPQAATPHLITSHRWTIPASPATPYPFCLRLLLRRDAKGPNACSAPSLRVTLTVPTAQTACCPKTTTVAASVHIAITRIVFRPRRIAAVTLAVIPR